jgi:3-hydroxyisobutyrate dehydrogenase-like beta-hydroxyacid dehydrogenase
MPEIGFIGLGNMGGPMATHLVEDGVDVTVFDLDSAAVEALTAVGAMAANDAPSLAVGSDVVFLSLPDPGAVVAVVDDIEDALEPGTILVDMTTSTPKTTTDIADRLAEREVDVLGAPVSGGRAGAKAGTLTVMVGGDAAVFEACEPYFHSFAATVRHVGEQPGHGHAVKLLNNYLSFTAFMATSEAVILGSQVGLDRQTLVEVFTESSGRNSATDDKIPNYVLTGEYDLGFPLSLMTKDIRLFTEFGDEFDTPLAIGSHVRQLIGYGRSALGDDADMTEMYDFFEEMMVGSDSTPT